MRNLHALIIAGGSGTRFWPASRRERPKQFLPLAPGGHSLLGATVDRLRGEIAPERIWILTNPPQAKAIPDLLPDFPRDRILVEPEARDTAPCIAYGTTWIDLQDPGALIAVMPADHLIEPAEDFHALLRRAATLAEDDRTLVTFGIAPDRPATGFGYIERSEALDEGRPPAYGVRRFREKPDRQTAEAFLRQGGFYWNSGIFVWSREALLAAAGPGGFADASAAMAQSLAAGDREAFVAAFRSAPKTSIDFAVMEQAPQVAVVEANLQWNDMGSFLAIGETEQMDAAGNAASLHGEAETLTLDAKDCLVYGEGGRTIALLGVRDLVVVAVDDAVMVCSRERAEELKKLVQALRDSGRDELL